MRHVKAFKKKGAMLQKKDPWDALTSTVFFCDSITLTELN
jgi:hypothetical protein